LDAGNAKESIIQGGCNGLAPGIFTPKTGSHATPPFLASVDLWRFWLRMSELQNTLQTLAVSFGHFGHRFSQIGGRRELWDL
jgi:hypothetical protein